jgi:N-methylhydantoinase A
MFSGRTPVVSSIRTTVVGPAPSLSLEALSARIAKDRRSARTAAPSLSRRLHIGPRSVDCPVYARDSLAIGQTVVGPAIIEQRDTTSLIDEGFRAYVDPHLNIRVQSEKYGDYVRR